MSAKPYSLNLDTETRSRLERVAANLAIGAIRPSVAEVMREAINRGLATLEDERAGRPQGSAR